MLLYLLVFVGVNHKVTSCVYLVFLSCFILNSEHKPFYFPGWVFWQPTELGLPLPFPFLPCPSFSLCPSVFISLKVMTHLYSGSYNLRFPLAYLFPGSSKSFQISSQFLNLCWYLISFPFHSTCLFPVKGGQTFPFDR